MAASTATVWTSAFCHELENMLRDNNQARRPRCAALTAQQSLGNHEGVQARGGVCQLHTETPQIQRLNRTIERGLNRSLPRGAASYLTPRYPFTLGEPPADTFQSKIAAVRECTASPGATGSSPADGYEYYMPSPIAQALLPL